MLEKLTIIHRADIRMITEVVEDGQLEFLGEVRDFRWDPVLADFINDHSRLGIAWSHLGPGKILVPHRHPIRSLILVCRGHGTALDQEDDNNHREIPVVEGDAILVPAMYKHGFRGEAPEGAFGLTIQFEERGLYEDEKRPQVSFK